MTPGGLPHSGIHGSTLADNSPWHIAAIHALLRLAAPRHPPCALNSSALREAPCRANRIELYQSSSLFGRSHASLTPETTFDAWRFARSCARQIDVGHTLCSC